MRLASALVFATLLTGLATRADDPAIVLQEFIYETGPYPSVHASTIVETPAHELVAAWFGGTRERAPDVGIWVSRREKNGWTTSVEAANGVQPDGTRYPTWNPVLFQPRNAGVDVPVQIRRSSGIALVEVGDRIENVGNRLVGVRGFQRTRAALMISRARFASTTRP